MYAVANVSVKRHQLKKLIKTTSKNFTQFRCECSLNVVNGNVAINKKLIETQEKSFRKIVSKQTGLKEKKRILSRESELLETVGLSCCFYLTES